MNKKGVGFGIFLLGVGIVWLLLNLNVINFNILGAFFTLWPLIFVVIGINIIFKEKSIVKGLTWLAFLIILIIYGSFGGKTATPFNGEWSLGTNDSKTSSHADELMRTGLKNGTLKIDAGAVQLNISDEIDKLLVLDADENNIKYNIDYNIAGDSVDIDLNNKNARVFGANKTNRMGVKLNNQVVWDIRMNTGASNGDIDLSKLKIKNLKISSGAVNYKVKLGANVPVTDISLESGASNFEFDIPSNDVGVRVKLDGALNNTNFSELGWTKNGSTYESLNYKDAKSKINMDANIGVAKIIINYK